MTQHRSLPQRQPRKIKGNPSKTAILAQNSRFRRDLARFRAREFPNKSILGLEAPGAQSLRYGPVFYSSY